jgi:hypothetical protein
MDCQWPPSTRYPSAELADRSENHEGASHSVENRDRPLHSLARLLGAGSRRAARDGGIATYAFFIMAAVGGLMSVIEWRCHSAERREP